MKILIFIFPLLASAAPIDPDYIDRMFESGSIAELDYGILPPSSAPDEPASEALPDRAPVGVPEGSSGRVPAGYPNRIPEGNPERGPKGNPRVPQRVPNRVTEGKAEDSGSSGSAENGGKGPSSKPAIEPDSPIHQGKSDQIAKAEDKTDDEADESGFIALYAICGCGGSAFFAFIGRLIYRAYMDGRLGIDFADRFYDQFMPILARFIHGRVPDIIPMPAVPPRALPPPS